MAIPRDPDEFRKLVEAMQREVPERPFLATEPRSDREATFQIRPKSASEPEAPEITPITTRRITTVSLPDSEREADKVLFPDERRAFEHHLSEKLAKAVDRLAMTSMGMGPVETGPVIDAEPVRERIDFIKGEWPIEAYLPDYGAAIAAAAATPDLEAEDFGAEIVDTSPVVVDPAAGPDRTGIAVMIAAAGFPAILAWARTIEKEWTRHERDQRPFDALPEPVRMIVQQLRDAGVKLSGFEIDSLRQAIDICNQPITADELRSALGPDVIGIKLYGQSLWEAGRKVRYWPSTMPRKVPRPHHWPASRRRRMRRQAR